MKRLASVVLLALLSGCAHPDSRHAQVSHELGKRTGKSLGVESAPGMAAMPPGTDLGQPLSDDDVAASALWNNAAFQEVLAELGLARADVILAGQLTNPSFFMLFPAGPKQLEFYAKIPLEALWLRPRRVAAAEFESQRLAGRVVQSGLDLVRDAKLACAEYRLSREKLRLAEQTVELSRQISALMRARFDAGDVSELETAMARIDALSAQEEIKRLRTDMAIAHEKLRHVMGLGTRTASFELTEQRASVATTRAADELVKDGLASRPDLRSAELAIESAGKRLKLARTEIYTLTAIIDANATDNGLDVGPGVEFPIPIFNQNQGNIAIADARLEQAVRRYATVRDQIVLEVRQSHARWQQANQNAAAWSDQLLPELEAAVNQSQKAVDAGDLPPLHALDARVKLNAARLHQQLALADRDRAVAELERAIGHRLDLPASPRRTSALSQP